MGELMTPDTNPFEEGEPSNSEPTSSEAAETIGQQWAESEAPLSEGFDLDSKPEDDPEAHEFLPQISDEDRALADQAQARWREERAQEAADEIRAQYGVLQQQVLDNAVSRFEAGEHPAEILNELGTPAVAPEVRDAFHAVWAAAEQGIDLTDPDPEDLLPSTAEEYSESAWEEYAQQQAATKQQQDAYQQAAWAEHWRGFQEAIPGEVQKAAQEMPHLAGRLVPLWTEMFEDQLARGLIPTAPEEFGEMVRGAARAAVELDRVHRVAETKADFAAHIDLWENNWLSDGPQPAFDRQAFVGAEMEKAADVRRVAPPPSRAERVAATKATLEPDARERALAEAFDLDPSPAEIAKTQAPKTARGETVGYRRDRR